MNRYPIAKDDGGWKKYQVAMIFRVCHLVMGKLIPFNSHLLKVSLKRSHDLIDPLIYITFICRKFTVSDFGEDK